MLGPLIRKEILDHILGFRFAMLSVLGAVIIWPDSSGRNSANPLKTGSQPISPPLPIGIPNRSAPACPETRFRSCISSCWRS